MSASNPLHLAVALDGAGWHPAAWREPNARPEALFTAGYWVDVVSEAERGLLDFVTIEDSLGLQANSYNALDDHPPQAGNGRVRGRLDAVLIASRIAPLTSSIGLVPTTSVTHTEPFHISKAIATLDYVSDGRAGWRPQLSGRPVEADHFGRRTIPVIDPTDQQSGVLTDLFEEAADFVEVVRRLWDSWEDDAEIRDAATGRFIDRDKLHYIDFEGRFFKVKGPSITPRPPQGQPLVTALAHVPLAYRFAAANTDLVYVTPFDAEQISDITAFLAAERERSARSAEALHVFGDLVVFIDESAAKARDRKARLDDLDGAQLTSDALIFTGTPEELADLLTSWQAAGLDGFRLRPGTIPDDLTAITAGLVPELQRRGLFRTRYEANTLRGLLGLHRPENRYVRNSTRSTSQRIQGVSA